MISRTHALLGALMISGASAAARVEGPAYQAARGVVGSIEVEYPPPGLAAKPVTDADARMLVRVTPLDDDHYRIEYLGLMSGDYDLAGLLQQRDGRPVSGLGPLGVQVFTQLPPGHGTDVFGLETSSVSLGSRYELIAGVMIALWLAAPIVVLTRRVLRRKPPVVVAPPEPDPTADELLRAAVLDAQGRELTAAERGRLELLLFRALIRAEDANDHTPDGLARTIAALRGDPRTEGVVLAVERWLHSNSADGGEAALRALDAHTRNPAEAGA